MAVPKTQIRVEQLTGSIPDDQIAAAAADELVLTSLKGTLNHIASSLYRLHGADTFSENASGIIKFADNAASAFAFKEAGNAYLEFVSTNSSEAVKISKTLDLNGDLDVDNATTDVNSSGAVSIDGGAASNFTTSAGALTIDAAAAGLVLDGHTGVDIDASNSGVVSIDGVGGINIGTATDTAIDIDASTLDIDVSGNVTIDASVGSISLGTNSSARQINIGHTTSEVVVNDNLTVTGNLTVSGDTVTVDVATLTVEDPLIKLNKGDIGNPARDQGFIFSRGNGSAADRVNRAFLWDESADEFVLADVTTETGDTSGNVTLADYEDLRLGALGVEDTIQVRDSALQISSPQDGSLTVEADGVLLLDCPTSIRFETRDSTSMANNAIDFAAAGEFVTFVSKFSNSTTVMGALNSIGGNRTKVIGKVGEVSGGVTPTGGDEGANPIAAEAGVDISGLAITMAGANAVSDSNVDVFLNGQLLLSGSASNLSAGAADYNVVDTNSLKFGFILQQGDIVTVVTAG